MTPTRDTASPAPCCLLTDNGSLRPDATFSLRRLAAALSEVVAHPVHPVSLLHSHKIAAEKLDGRPADTFERFILAKREEGIDSFLVTPLFFGPSAAVCEYLPQRVEAVREEHRWPQLEVRVAPCLVDVEPGARTDDTRVARLLLDLVDATTRAAGFDRPAVALCDHGAPRIRVTEVRNLLARQMAALAGDRFSAVEPCSMERREGDEYAFNEPLLENLLGSPGFQGDVVVSMLFFQPGRHAGPDGDVASICRHAESRHPHLDARMTDLVVSHPGLIPLLAERFHQGLDSPPVRWSADVPATG